MEKEECWENFLASGKVTDYLSYCQAAEHVVEGENDGGNAAAQAGERPDGKVKHNAGFY